MGGADNPGKAAHAERRQIALLEQHTGIDLIVLARYMQILSPEFVARYPNRIINVHHSFLPAFTGAKAHTIARLPAPERGVKLHRLLPATTSPRCSTTAPIIEQDVTRISHRDRSSKT